MSIYSDIHRMAGESDSHLVTDEESINQNIMMIAGTPKGSKWWRPRIGSFLSRFLYEPIDGQTAFSIETELENALTENLENRVQIIEIEVIPDPAHARYYIRLLYRLVNLPNKKVELKFSFGKDV